MLFQFLINDSTQTTLLPNFDNLTVLIFKILFLVAAFLYVLFAIVVVRQISIMRSTLITEFSSVLTVVGIAHLLLSIGVLLFFIISL